jgi:NTP pyrophosphatase (non-canonical NTP hydrolase)
MNFDEYQKEAWQHAFYPDKGNNLMYPIVGLFGEGGEVAEKIKKIVRDKQGVASSEDIMSLKKEIGDVLWYLAALCSELNISFEEVAKLNIEKILGRKERGTQYGSGDDR